MALSRDYLVLGKFRLGFGEWSEVARMDQCELSVESLHTGDAVDVAC